MAGTVTYTTLVSFTDTTTNANNAGSDGPNGLTIDASGNLYGTTGLGGTGSGNGTVFEIAAGTQTLTNLYTFGNNATYSYPSGTLTLDASGNIYGTTQGQANSGVFVITSGTHQFRTVAAATGGANDLYQSGVYISGSLAPNATAGTATVYGIDVNLNNNAAGSIFKSTLTGGASSVTGTAPTLAPIGNGSGSSQAPLQYEAPLYVSRTNSLYVTTAGDGTSNNPGGIYGYSLSTGQVTQTATFNATTGYNSVSSLIADASGNLYGTSQQGGTSNQGTIFEYVAASGTVKALASFNTNSGYLSQGPLLLDGAGNLFGTTTSGGTVGDGTVFELTAGGTSITTVYNLTTGQGGVIGADSNLVADANGNLYGTTQKGGTANLGSVFEVQNSGFVPVCYCSGTLIRTVRGDVAVEALVVGDLAVTSSGEHRPIRWIGHQTHRLAGPAQPRSAWPVRVAAGAFGDNKPDRDLFLSPGHSVCVGLFDEVLVPVQELVNGSTVAYVTDWTDVTYWHVELDSHDVLIANNMPAESFLEMGENRRFFDGVGAPDVAPDVLARSHADFCRRFVDGGPLLATMRDELKLRAERLGWQPSREVAITCHAGESVVRPYVNGGEALFAIPTDAGELRVSTGLSVPALLGEADDRSLGLAVYGIAVLTPSGEERSLDLDDAAVRDCFHSGERQSGLHYRWTRGDIVLPPSAIAGLSGPLMLRLRFENSTIRGWREPAHRAQKPILRVVA